MSDAENYNALKNSMGQYYLWAAKKGEEPKYCVGMFSCAGDPKWTMSGIRWATIKELKENNEYIYRFRSETQAWWQWYRWKEAMPTQSEGWYGYVESFE